jgi:hypothetical protein
MTGSHPDQSDWMDPDQMMVVLTRQQRDRVLELVLGQADEYPPEYGTHEARTDDAIAAKLGVDRVA